MGDPDEWRIDHLTLTNVRRFSTLHVPLSDVTVLVGRNGSGKTAVLDALAVLLSPAVRELGGGTVGFETRDVRNRARDLHSASAVATIDPIFPVVAEASGVIAGMPCEWSRRRNSLRGRTTQGDASLRSRVKDLALAARDSTTPDPRLPVIAHYGVERLTGVRRASVALGASRFDAYASALDPRSDLTRLSAFLEALSRQITDAVAFDEPPPNAARAQFAAIDEACSVVLESTGWSRPRWNPVVKELTLTHDERGALPFSWLATGTKIAAGLAIDLASRMARANPSVGKTELLATTPGIVLIDEVDLHLHPGWQQRIVPSLRRAFPRVQFILTTHSPQVLSTVDAASIQIIENDEVRSPAYAEGLRSDVVLREVQGTDPTPDVKVREDLDDYVQRVFRGEGTSLEAVTLRRRLDDKLGGVINNDELAEADAYLAIAGLDL